MNHISPYSGSSIVSCRLPGHPDGRRLDLPRVPVDQGIRRHEHIHSCDPPFRPESGCRGVEHEADERAHRHFHRCGCARPDSDLPAEKSAFPDKARAPGTELPEKARSCSDKLFGIKDRRWAESRQRDRGGLPGNVLGQDRSLDRNSPQGLLESHRRDRRHWSTPRSPGG